MTGTHVEQQVATLPERGATYVDCRIDGVHAERADLRHSDLTGARVSGTDLSRADLSGAVGYVMHPERTRLSGTIVSLPEGAAVLAALGMVVRTTEDRLTTSERLAAG